VTYGKLGDPLKRHFPASLTEFQNGALIDRRPVTERFDFGTALTHGIHRIAISIPQSYGRLIHISDWRAETAKGPMLSLWFEDEEGNLRNVPLSVSQPFVIKRAGKVSGPEAE
jgi:hypothetical protein